jgi:hypothetical protein
MTFPETCLKPHKRIAGLLWICARSGPAQHMEAHGIPRPQEPKAGATAAALEQLADDL